MLIARASRRPAILCALLLAVCTLASYPFAEMGGNDDFAYVRSAKALADTGHMVYFGWSSAMLGWQLALGALFIKLFGASFTVTRASILLVAAATEEGSPGMLNRMDVTEPPNRAPQYIEESRMMADTGCIPKVSGSSSDTPLGAPRPGSTPTRMPSSTPINIRKI